MTILYPILYQDSVDLEGDSDNIVTLLTPPEQRMLQSILNNVESNPDIFIKDYYEQDTDVVDEFLAKLMLKLMGVPTVEWLVGYVPISLEDYETNTGTWTYSSQPTDWRGAVWALAPAINNLVRWDYVALKKGTYVVRVGCRQGATFGVGHFRLNGTTVGTIDFYSAGSTVNNRRATAPFTVSADGIYQFEIKMLTRNVSASNYAMQLNWLEFVRTGD